jgi:hypothetical protein
LRLEEWPLAHVLSVAPEQVEAHRRRGSAPTDTSVRSSCAMCITLQSSGHRDLASRGSPRAPAAPEHRSVGGVASGTVVPIPSSEGDGAAIVQCEQAIAVTLHLMHPARTLRRRLSRLGKLRAD